ncbi:MAG TPA: ribbon-helix-helix domain-containing protein [Stellaceae bacterium]|nr:ribbon-helix-helix domain-containing protein [Stellaceae bacterium]
MQSSRDLRTKYLEITIRCCEVMERYQARQRADVEKLRRRGGPAAKIAEQLLRTATELAATLEKTVDAFRRSLPKIHRSKEGRPPEDDQRLAAIAARAKVVTVGGLPYLVSLEPAVWAMLKEIRRREGITQGALMNAIRRAYGTDFSSAIPLYILGYFRNRATESGHRQAGHGMLVSRI